MGVQLIYEQPELQSTLGAAGLRRYEDFVGADFGEIVAQSATSQTRCICLNSTVTPIRLFLKVYRHQSHRRRSAMRRDKAAIEAANYRFMRYACGMDVPEVVCYGSRRGLISLRDAFILTRQVPDATTLDAFVAARWPNAAAASIDSLRMQLISRTAAMLRRMHDVCFFHVDLQWRNVLISQASTGRPRILFIDSSRGQVRRWRVLREHGRLRDLSSLAKMAVIHMTRTERLRWFKLYLGVPRLTRQHADLIRAIEMDRVLKDNSVQS